MRPARRRKTRTPSLRSSNTCAWPCSCCAMKAVRRRLRPATRGIDCMDIPASEYARRRRQLMRMIGGDAIAIVAAAPQRIRSHDTHYPYRQDSDFHYLCSFPEPEAVLVLVPGRAAGETLLFCRERDPDRERWDGPRAGLEGAVEQYGADDAYPIGD